VQAITDKADKVIGYSVTSRDKDFNPKFALFNIYLGKSTFKDINKEFGGKRDPEWLISNLGAHDIFYTEGYYLGNPGYYQSFFFSMSMVGYSKENDFSPIPDYVSSDLDMNFGALNSNALPPDVKALVDNNTNIINTYTVLSPFVSINDISSIRKVGVYDYLFGPDKNQVRLLDYSARP
jgi:hypothetical protein